MERLYYLILRGLVSRKVESGYPSRPVRHKFKFFISILCFLMLLLSASTTEAQTTDHWETVVKANDIWRYFIGNNEPPSTWTNIDFDDSFWLSGPGGIGYGDNDDSTIISPVTSLYLRMNFILIDTSVISTAILNVDFDDGFVAYLNGHEVARANIGTTGIRPLFSDFAILNTYEAQLPSGGIPAQFLIDNDTLMKYLIQGGNVLAIQVHNCNATSSDLSSSTWLSIGITDDSHEYYEPPLWFNVILNESSDLPLLVIDTWGQSIADDPKIRAWLKVMDNGPGQSNSILQDGTDYDGYIWIETRGQSSQRFPKKSFGFETRDSAGTDIDVSLLGMPEEEDWILYAPYSDKSMLRNAITFHLGKNMNDWQPRYKFCEVYLNGFYHGVYMLMEKIKHDQNRVDISKLNPDETTGNDLTGGYIVKVDKTNDLLSNEFFRTYPQNSYKNARNYDFTYVYPKYDEIVPEQKTYIYNYLEECENILNGSSFEDLDNGFRKYLDIGSFVDFQIIQELANNVDGYRFSTFFFKKKDSNGGKLYAGPLWDFDLCYGNVDYSDKNLSTSTWLFPNFGPTKNYPMHWWARLMEDAGYRNALVSRWEELRTGAFHTDSILTYIDYTVSSFGDAVDRNFTRWPILGRDIWPNFFIGATYEQEIEYLKDWIVRRLNWMDENIPTVGRFKINTDKYSVLVYPNPVRDQLNIQLYLNYLDKVDIEIFDLSGAKVFSSEYFPGLAGQQEILLNVPKVLTGYYILNIKQGERILSREKVVICR